MADASFDFANLEVVSHVIQVSLTPVFLLSGVGTLLGVFSTRLIRVADQVEDTTGAIEGADARRRLLLERRLAHLQMRSYLLDAAVILAAVAGAATAASVVALFVEALFHGTGRWSLFLLFGTAVLCTTAALMVFLVEILLASRGVRDQLAEQTRGGRARA